MKVEGRPQKTLHGERRWGQPYRKPSCVASTPGLGDVYFDIGKGMKKGGFQETLKKLSRCAGMNFKIGAVELQKDMEKLIEPSHTEARQVDKNYVFEMTIWKSGYAQYHEEVKYWVANKTHAFTLVSVHFTPELEEKLEENEET